MATKRRTKELYRLKVGPDGLSGRFAPLCEIHHVSHLATAMTILRKGRIPARRVQDQSRLDRRMSVCWLAPNQWGGMGSRYGTVQFTFDFENLVRGRQIYWVEGVPGRSLATCRLLITDRVGSPLGLKRYDPDVTEGPLRRVDGRWYWKDDIEFELMVEGGLSLASCVRVGAVAHNGDRCRRTCGEVGQSAHDTAAKLLAGLMTERYALPQTSFVHAGRASELLQGGWFGLVDTLDPDLGGTPGRIKGSERVDAAVMKALRRLRKGDIDGAVGMIAKVSGWKRVRRSLKRLLQRCTGMELGNPYDPCIGLVPPAAPGSAATKRAGGGHRRGTSRTSRDGDVEDRRGATRAALGGSR